MTNLSVGPTQKCKNLNLTKSFFINLLLDKSKDKRKV